MSLGRIRLKLGHLISSNIQALIQFDSFLSIYFSSRFPLHLLIYYVCCILTVHVMASYFLDNIILLRKNAFIVKSGILWVKLLLLASNAVLPCKLPQRFQVLLIDLESRVSFSCGSVPTDNGFKSCCDNSFLISLFHESLPCSRV